MGSLRRGLILALLPLPAWAEVCSAVRPNWDGIRLTAFDEAVLLFASPPALILLIASAFVIRTKNQWGALTAFVLWTVLASVVVFSGRDAQQLALAEGCMGPNTWFIIGVSVLCIAMILYTVPRPKT